MSSEPMSNEQMLDEPQFAVDKKATSTANSKGKSKIKLVGAVLFLIGAVGLLASYDTIMSRIKAHKSDNSAEITGQVNQNDVGISAFESPFVVNGSNKKEFIEVDVSESVDTELQIIPVDNSNENYGDISIAVLEKLSALEAQLNAISRMAEENKNNLSQQVHANKVLINNVEASVSDIYQTLLTSNKTDSKRYAFIKSAFSQFNQFSSDVKTSHESLDFEILHAESWAGKKRLIGYQKVSPDHVLKIYEGHKVGRWLLKSIQEDKAIFILSNGTRKEVVIP